MLNDHKKINEMLELEIAERKQMEVALQQRTHDLGERVKELTGLYSISSIFERYDTTLEEGLEQIVEVFPPAWHYPEITCARITFDGREYTSKNYKETIWGQASDLIVYGERVGGIGVFYLEEKPELDEGPFLEEERNLINEIAGRLGEIIERKQAEAKYRELYNNAPDMLVAVDPKSATIIECNQTIATATGYTREEILGRSIIDLYHPDSVKDAQKTFQLFLEKGELKNVELQLLGKDGSRIEVSMNGSTVHDEKGRIIESRCSWRDITERKQMENETKLLREELTHVERVSTAGEMTAILAHDLNQYLSTIASYAYGCINKLHFNKDEPDVMLKNMELITEQAGQATDLITQVQRFVRKDKPRWVSIDVNQLANEIAGLIMTEAHTSQVEIILDFNDDMPLIKGNPIELQQVILNLVRNGIEAMRDTDLSSRQLTITTAKHEGDMIAVAISDMGSGVSREDGDRLFAPFFTTKANGMGLGLTICRTIIEAHGGKINFVPDVKIGTVARFTLPVSEEGVLDEN